MSTPNVPTTDPAINAAAVAKRCKDFFVAYWAARGWDLPERRYVGGGNPRGGLAVDGELFMVALAQVEPGTMIASGGAPSKGAGPSTLPQGTFVVRVMRQVPNLDGEADYAPSAEELDEAGMALLLDPGRLIDTLFAWRGQDTAFGSSNATVTIGRVTPQGPMGFLAGHDADFQISPVQ